MGNVRMQTRKGKRRYGGLRPRGFSFKEREGTGGHGKRQKNMWGGGGEPGRTEGSRYFIFQKGMEIITAKRPVVNGRGKTKGLRRALAYVPGVRKKGKNVNHSRTRQKRFAGSWFEGTDHKEGRTNAGQT